MPRDMTLFEADDEGAVEGSTVGGDTCREIKGGSTGKGVGSVTVGSTCVDGPWASPQLPMIPTSDEKA